ncbi:MULTISPECIES: hypothetical protein [Dyella]|uniref:Uncharacterized protein n=2 Tax=Dyella TaxID=231454 RepID=A0A4R0Z0V8_9GAMM|nr:MULTISPECIES: hypothetical protein [Dyella]TBR40548.1 hypothetical protein EYV96_10465 [Dyella terrae]TCI11870.1 hypothetical protein EZM97_00405 [Dyella soli]
MDALPAPDEGDEIIREELASCPKKLLIDAVVWLMRAGTIATEACEHVQHMDCPHAEKFRHAVGVWKIHAHLGTETVKRALERMDASAAL